MTTSTQNGSFTISCKLEINRPRKREYIDKSSIGRIPRISRLMALAIHFEQLIREGTVSDYADIARLGYVTRARLTQIMNLNLLAPDIQEEILFLPEVTTGPDPITERQVRKINKTADWKEQKEVWDKRKNKSFNPLPSKK